MIEAIVHNLCLCLACASYCLQWVHPVCAYPTLQPTCQNSGAHQHDDMARLLHASNAKSKQHGWRGSLSAGCFSTECDPLTVMSAGKRAGSRRRRRFASGRRFASSLDW